MNTQTTLTGNEQTLFDNHINMFKALNGETGTESEIEDDASNEAASYSDLLNRLLAFSDNKSDNVFFNLELMFTAFLEKKDSSLPEVNRTYHDILSLLVAIFESRNLLENKCTKYKTLQDIFGKREKLARQ
jgi:hypothetical protein